MKVRLWDRKKDYATVEAWWTKYDKLDYLVPNSRLPASGWVVEDEDGTPLCFGWLYIFAHVSGGLVGSIVSNPDTDKKTNCKALDLFFLKLVTETDRLNLDVVVGVTTREGIVRKAAKFGFSQTTKHSVEYQRERGDYRRKTK
jgi:hypothetical protein